MAQPPPYDRSYNFHDYQAENPLKPLPADKLDEEFSRVKTTIDAVLQNLALIQRDDTALANKSVGYDQLKDEIQLGFNPPTDWTANHNYIVRDTVFVDVAMYRCVVSHVSSNDFGDDLNAGYWELVVDFAGVQTAAIAARDAALQAQADAEDARDDALQAQADAESARDAAIGAKNDAEAAKTASESARDAAVVAKGLAEAAQAGAEQAQADAEAAQQAAEDARDDAIAAQNLAEGFKDDAEAAKTASESARDAAVVAQGLAEAAQQAAEDARDDALQAQADAESARDDAVIAKTASESARDDAVVAKNAAEDAQADAEAAQLAAENARDAAIQAKNDAEGFKDDAESAASDAQDALSTAQSIYANMSGGLTGQFLMKQSDDDYDYTWADVAGGGGIMLASVYDPNGVAGDAFDMDNMVEGSTNLILTAAERADIAANTSARHSHDNKAILDATEQAFTTALKNKLDGIEAGAQVNAVTSVAGKTGAVTLSASDINGLGDAATRNVGTTSGTVAAGDDSRITGALQPTITTMVTFNLPLSSSNKLMELQQGYSIYSDNTGAGSHNSRLWFDGPDGGEVLIGPRAGASFLHQIRLRADTTRIEGDCVVTGNLTLNGSVLGSLPVGSTYIQMPGEATPSSLFGGTWTLLFNNEGIFFRTEGGNASSFGGGIQSDELKSHTHSGSTNSAGAHTHNSGVSYGSGNGLNSAFARESTVQNLTPVITGSAGAHTHTVTINATGGAETRPRNRTVRVWKRTA